MTTDKDIAYDILVEAMGKINELDLSQSERNELEDDFFKLNK